MAINRTDYIAAGAGAAAVAMGAYFTGQTNLVKLFDRTAFGAAGLGACAWNQYASSVASQNLAVVPLDHTPTREHFNMRATMALLFAMCVKPAMTQRFGSALLGAVIANGVTHKGREYLAKKPKK